MISEPGAGLGVDYRTWWWEPRYRLAELERAGMRREMAVSKVLAEYGSFQPALKKAQGRKRG